MGQIETIQICIQTLTKNIAKLKIPNLILAGDWNLVLDPTIDYCNYKRTNNVKAQEKVEEIIADHCLVHIWRELSLQLQRFTRRRTNPCQQSRLDFFLISENLCNTVRDTDITPGYRTDHSMLTLELSFGEDWKKDKKKKKKKKKEKKDTLET